MNILRAVAASAILITSQAYAVDTIVQSNLTLTQNGRNVHFKLPLNGDTKTCIVTYSYGEKPGVGPSNDGDSHMNGQSNGDRSRTYSADGTYTFIAKTKSGCSGEAKITFTIGTPAPAPAPARAGVAPSAHTNLSIAHGKFKNLQVSATSLKVGMPLTVTLNGTGAETQCEAMVFVAHNNGTYAKYSPPPHSGTGGWPRKHTFTMDKPGTYKVYVNQTGSGGTSVEAELLACGGNSGLSNLPGNSTIVEVMDIPK